MDLYGISAALPVAVDRLACELTRQSQDCGKIAYVMGVPTGTYSKVESDFSILSLNVCEEAGLLVRRDFVGKGRSRDERREQRKRPQQQGCKLHRRNEA